MGRPGAPIPISAVSAEEIVVALVSVAFFRPEAEPAPSQPVVTTLPGPHTAGHKDCAGPSRLLELEREVVFAHESQGIRDGSGLL